MASSPTSRLRFVAPDGSPLDAPREARRAFVVVDCERAEIERYELRRNGEQIELRAQRIAARWVVAAAWPVSEPGYYDLTLTDAAAPESPETRTCLVAARKLDDAEVRALVDDLQTNIPGSLAFGLTTKKAYAGVTFVRRDRASVAQELAQLRIAVDGSPRRAGLVSLLAAIGRQPHQELRSAVDWTAAERARHVHGPGLAHAFARAGNVDAARRPAILPTQRVTHSYDVYENRVVRYYHDRLARRIAALVALPQELRVRDAATDLAKRLRAARHGAAFLDDAAPLAATPVDVTAVMTQRAEYRAVAQGLRHLQRRALIRLEDADAEAPLSTAHRLYERWLAYQVVVAVRDAGRRLGYAEDAFAWCDRVDHDFVVRLRSGGGRPCVVLRHPRDGGEVRLFAQKQYDRESAGPRSISFPQMPDLSLEIARGDATDIIIFDAKYKLRSEGDRVDGEDGRPAKADIDAMHTYADAIRDRADRRVVRLAAVLYPGQDEAHGTHLRAIQARPGRVDELQDKLRAILVPALRPLRSAAMTDAPQSILHITTEDGWAAAEAAGELVAPSLAEEGFIHCSTWEQVAATANRIFRGSGELLLLELIVEDIGPELKWERATDVGEDFPHIYGPLNLDAVLGTVTMAEGPDGYTTPPRF